MNINGWKQLSLSNRDKWKVKVVKEIEFPRKYGVVKYSFLREIGRGPLVQR